MELKRIYKKVRPYSPPILLNKIADIIHFIDFQKYKKIISKNKVYKNKYSGQRCFILGSGPSILKQDIKYLKNENLIAMNNFCVHKDFNYIFSGKGKKFYIDAPSHLPHTEETIMKESKRMDEKTKNNVVFFLGLNRYKINLKFLKEKYGLFKNKEVNYYYAGICNNEFSTLKESHLDIDKMTIASFTCLVYAITIAVYMGFKEIYLLGCDFDYICNLDQKDSHFFKHKSHEKEVASLSKNSEETLKQRMGYGMYRVLKVYNEIKKIKKNTKIINLSPTSLIDVFEKEDYSNLLRRLKLKNGNK